LFYQGKELYDYWSLTQVQYDMHWIRLISCYTCINSVIFRESGNQGRFLRIRHCGNMCSRNRGIVDLYVGLRV
jgi:hypothetical protein